MSQHRVALETHRAGQHDDVLRVTLQGPRRGIAWLRTTLGALIDQHQPDPSFDQWIEVVGELVMVQPRPAVQHQQREPVLRPSFHDPQGRVVDRDEPAGPVLVLAGS